MTLQLIRMARVGGGVWATFWDLERKVRRGWLLTNNTERLLIGKYYKLSSDAEVKDFDSEDADFDCTLYVKEDR